MDTPTGDAAPSGPSAVATPSASSQQASGVSKPRPMSRPSGHISRAAVSLAWLLRFVKENKVRQRGLTTANLVPELVMPATLGAQCRYTDWMLRDADLQGAVSQGRPFYFISHTWSRPFMETVGMVARHFEPEQQLLWRRDGELPLAADEVFVWFDMFAVNQHKVGQNVGDLAALWEAVVDADETLMVLDPHGTLLTRIWCLYEAWQSSRAGPGKLRVLSYGIDFKQLEKGRLPGSHVFECQEGVQEQVLRAALGGWRADSKNPRQVFINLDVSLAQASAEEDRVRILAHIKEGVGSLNGMTHRLKDALVAGVVAQVPPPAMPWTKETDDKVYAAARLSKLYGRLDQAEALYRRAMDSKERLLGADSKETLASVNNLALLLQSKGRLEDAEALFRRAQEVNERVQGPDDLDTLTYANNLGRLLKAQGKLEEAEPLCRRVLEVRERVLGPKDPSTFTSLNTLAGLLEAQDKLDQAEPLYRRALAGSESVQGWNHPDTFIYLNNLAVLLKSWGKLEEAEPLHQRALEGRERVLGPSHPDTLTSMNNLALLLQSRGKLAEAEVLCRRAMEVRERQLGPNHLDTLVSVNNLAGVLKSQGRLDDAEALYRRALEGKERVLGPNHPSTLKTVKNLAALLKSRGKLEEAERLYRRAHKGSG